MSTQADALKAAILGKLQERLNEQLRQMTRDTDRTIYSLAKRKGVIQGLQSAIDDVEAIFKDIDSIYEGRK